MAINALVFLSMVVYGLGFLSFRPADLVAWGAIYSPLIRQGQWLRLVTALFIHGGLMHLLLNLYGLLFAAFFLEGTIGTARFILAYFLCGIIASLTSVWLHPNGVSIGASGAIFGLYGVLLVYLAGKGGKDTRGTPILLNVAIFVGLNLLLGGVAAGVDNAAHVGGLLSGLLFGIVFLATDQIQRRSRDRMQD
jgi:membrane associated rhomboid family serine protease